MIKAITLTTAATALLLTASISHAEGHISKQSAKPSTISLGPHAVWDLKLSGPFNVKLKDSRRTNITVSGSNSSIDNLSEHITRHGLSIENSGKQPIMLTLGGNSLKKLTVNDATINSQHLHSHHHIAMTVTGDSHLNLNGSIKIKKIISKDNAAIHIRWLDADNLRIIASDRSRLTLSGHVKVSDIRLQDYAVVRATSLTTESNKTQTKNYAMANINVRNTLRAFASGNSGIYYSVRPKFLTQVSSDQANILELS